MKSLSRICLGLAIFLAVAGTVYGLTSHEPVGALTFLFLFLVLRSASSRASEEEQEEEELQIGPTIWPFGFALSGAVVVIGVIVTDWLVVVGVLAFAVCAWGWLREVTRSHAAHD